MSHVNTNNQFIALLVFGQQQLSLPSVIKEQTVVELHMRHTANWWAGLSVCVSPARRVRHGLTTVVDSMWESLHALL